MFVFLLAVIFREFFKSVNTFFNSCNHLPPSDFSIKCAFFSHPGLDNLCPFSLAYGVHIVLAVSMRGKTTLRALASSPVVKGSSLFPLLVCVSLSKALSFFPIVKKTFLFLELSLVRWPLPCLPGFVNIIPSCLVLSLPHFFSSLPLSYQLFFRAASISFLSWLCQTRHMPKVLSFLKAHIAPMFRTVTTSSKHLSQLCLK